MPTWNAILIRNGDPDFPYFTTITAPTEDAARDAALATHDPVDGEFTVKSIKILD